MKIHWDGRFFVSTMRLYSTLGRLFKHLSNFHAIYFIFLPKDELCLKSETLFHWCFCSNQSSLPWKSFPRCQNTTLQVRESGWQGLEFSLSTHQAPSGNSVGSCSPNTRPSSCQDVAAWVCPEGVESPPHPEVLSLLPSEYGEWRVMVIWMSTLLLWGRDTNGYLTLSVTNSKDHFNHVRFKYFHLCFWW